MIKAINKDIARGVCESCCREQVLYGSSYLNGYSWLCLECYTDEHLTQPISECYKRAAGAEGPYSSSNYFIVSSLYISRLIYCLRAYEKGENEAAARAMKDWGIEL